MVTGTCDSNTLFLQLSHEQSACHQLNAFPFLLLPSDILGIEASQANMSFGWSVLASFHSKLGHACKSLLGASQDQLGNFTKVQSAGEMQEGLGICYSQNILL